MTSLKEDLKSTFWSPTPLVVWVLVTLMAAYAGPFGTYQGNSLLRRVLYWGVVAGLSIAIGLGIRVVVRYWLRDRGYWIVSTVTAASVAVLLFCPLTLLTEQLSVGTGNQVPSALEMMGLIFVVGMGMSAIRMLIHGGWHHRQGAGPRLMERVDPDLRGKIIRCAAYDHYVSLYTDKGETRLLMRFADAIAELDGVDGLQVHRSHWVAASAVIGNECENGRIFLQIEDGSKVPVSRNFRPAVAERGLV